MRVGMIGLGKLGLPVALAIEAAGHEVVGWDPSPAVQDYIAYRRIPYVEEGAQELLDNSRIEVWPAEQVAEECDLVFVAVQTPHQPEFEGVTRLTEKRADFDYSYLAKAMRDARYAKTLVVISTVLPGTMDRLMWESGADQGNVLYNPFFIAMGTTIPDFRDPEFVLIGTDGAWPEPLIDLYRTIHSKFCFVTSIKTAELTKVAYNTFIGMKIVFANAMMEICEKTGADVDDLVDALSLADRRVVSAAYLRGGMGDGGGCHPRDNIALSWLAREVGLSYDLFGEMMLARERQTEWLAELVSEHAGDEVGQAWPRGDYVQKHPVHLLGRAYKPNTALTVGSPATLLSNILTEYGVAHTQSDPYAQGDGREEV